MAPHHITRQLNNRALHACCFGGAVTAKCKLLAEPQCANFIVRLSPVCYKVQAAAEVAKYPSAVCAQNGVPQRDMQQLVEQLHDAADTG